MEPLRAGAVGSPGHCYFATAALFACITHVLVAGAPAGVMQMGSPPQPQPWIREAQTIVPRLFPRQHAARGHIGTTRARSESRHLRPRTAR